MQNDNRPVLVTGATGYVGGRLAPMLLQKGYPVRAMARSAGKLRCRPWAQHENLDIAEADVLHLDAVRRAVQGCRVVYYLIHSMSPKTEDFAAADRAAARHMVRAAEEAGVERIIYLGGLTPAGEELSHHLQSREEVAQILGSGVPALTSLHAAQILGAGSASFEIIRYLTERLPVMITPRWVYNECQPISIRDVLGYLAGCLEKDETAGQRYDIGGPDIMSYADFFQLYAEAAGLRKRTIISVPVLTPTLSSYWIGLVTPIPSSLARPLVKGLRNRVVCSENRIRELIPLPLSTCRETISRALERVQQNTVDTCWSDAGDTTPPEWIHCGDASYAGGTVLELGYTVRLQCAAMDVWPQLSAVGGESGWYFGEYLWKLRGFVDQLIGGVGLRRGRRDMQDIRTGDALDFWRVLDASPGERLLLLAEMTTPGEALLEFTLTEQTPGETVLAQRSRFLPRGAFGLAYWWATYPLHVYVFKGMLRQIAKRTGKPVLSGPSRLTRQDVPACFLKS